MHAGGTLSGAQSGFRKGHSTTTCMIDFLHHIFTGMDDGETSGVLFLDLKNSFDTVDHYLLLRKLRGIGLKEVSVSWFASYLGNRYQTTKYESSVSERLPISCGVPQGSILGKLLFIIFVNDFPNVFQEAHVNLYADDTAITVRARTADELQRKLKSQVESAANWLRANKLTLNIRKMK